jgi:hypothetical protein
LGLSNRGRRVALGRLELVLRLELPEALRVISLAENTAVRQRCNDI